MVEQESAKMQSICYKNPWDCDEEDDIEFSSRYITENIVPIETKESTGKAICEEENSRDSQNEISIVNKDSIVPKDINKKKCSGNNVRRPKKKRLSNKERLIKRKLRSDKLSRAVPLGRAAQKTRARKKSRIHVLALFVIFMVVRCLDLKPLLDTYSHVGAPSLDPVRMLAIMLYAYLMGVRSSRKIESKLYEDDSFKYIASGMRPDHASISRFKTRIAPFFESYRIATLTFASDLGVLKTFASTLDGTKICANASRHRCYSFKRACELKVKLEDEISKLHDKIKYEKRMTEEIQREIFFKLSKLGIVDKALKRMEKMWAAIYAEKKAAYDLLISERETFEVETGRKPRGKAPVPPSQRVPDAFQTSLTDPESRIMLSSNKGFDLMYNCQCVVENESRLILTGHVTQHANDVKEMAITILKLKNLPEKVGKVRQILCDSGYFSKLNIDLCIAACIDPYMIVV
jgi:transposase